MRTYCGCWAVAQGVMSDGLLHWPPAQDLTGSSPVLRWLALAIKGGRERLRTEAKVR